MSFEFTFHSWRRNFGNFSLLKYRDFQSFLVTGENSGTHWLKYMLSLAIADKFDLPPPAYTDNPDSNDFIGHPKHSRKYNHTPRIASSHNIPSQLLNIGLLDKMINFPNYVILVRDMRAALVSCYERHKHRYGISFSDFLVGNITGNLHRADIWWHIRFCNGWGKIMRQIPKKCLLVHYENLLADPLFELQRINEILLLDLNKNNLLFGIENSSKKDMAAKVKDKQGLEHKPFIRFDSRDPLQWYSDADRKVFNDIVSKNLIYNPGYDFTDWNQIKIATV